MNRCRHLKLVVLVTVALLAAASAVAWGSVSAQPGDNPADGLTKPNNPAREAAAARAAQPSQVPTGLSPAEWHRILAQVAKLTADDGAEYDFFGDSVSVSGDTALVGAWAADPGGNTRQGAAYVFCRDRGGPDAWGQVAKLTADDGAAHEAFGWYVSVDGDTALIGAYAADVGGNENQGAAYVFYRDRGGPDAWGQVAKLTADDGVADDFFGVSVSVDGDIAVVGADYADIGGKMWQGAAYVFYRDRGGPDAWGQVAKLTADDGAAMDRFGRFLSVSGEAVVVGVSSADVGGNEDQGAAYVFYRDQGGPDAWGQIAKLTATDGAAEDQFGHSVSLDGDTAVLGANWANVGGNVHQGAAYVFYRDRSGPDAWGQVAKLTAADGAADDWFGWAASISGDTTVVGAYYADIGGNENQGAAHVFCRDQDGPDAWGQVAKLTAADGTEFDYFGVSVSASGAAVVVGAYGADSDIYFQGAAYVYDLAPHRVYLPLVMENH